MKRRPETETELWCGACQTMHPKVDFGRDKNAVAGLAHACKKVVSERNGSYHSRHRDTLNPRHKERREERRLSPESREWTLKKLLGDARQRAKTRGLPFSLTLADLVAIAPEYCPVFGWPLVYQARIHRVPASASLDRFDPTGGYTPDNIWVISWRANQIKSDALPWEVLALYGALRKRAAGHLLDGVEWREFPE